jgi:hypothetical protein
LITPDKTKAEHFENSVKLKPKQFFQRIEEMKEKNEPSIVFKLFDTYPEKLIQEQVELTPNILRKIKFMKPKGSVNI